jgi:hypothetical protein
MQKVDLDKLDAMRESTTVEPSSANTMWLHEIHNAYPALAEELRALRVLRALVDELVDDEDCCYDHHGYCQAHSLQAKPCPHERAKALLN